MSRWKLVFVGLAAFSFVAAWPGAARAQSTIAGVVKDGSGAVLPGVTVEAASDVLIEKTRSVVTDGAGEYKIIDLRPGTYIVTFTLTGFQPFRREGLELPAGFTATVDAAMKVGSIEESVTVSGASPVVDVQSNVKQQTLARDVLEAVPNVHTIQSVGQLIPGVTLSAPDTGGSQQMQQTYFSVHGLGQTGTTMKIDGMILNSIQGDGAQQMYFTTSASQEMVYQTGGGGGESTTGGLNINMIPREGGNRFTGSSSLGINAAGWQSDNFSQELKDQGVTSVDKIGSYHDFDAAEGGPIMKDRLWFFVLGRSQSSNKPVANTTQSNTLNLIGNPNAMAAALAACRATAGSCPQGVSPESITSGQVRLTWQMNQKNKLAVYVDRLHKNRSSALASGDDQSQTGILWTSPLYVDDYVKWSSPVTNKLLLEGGWSSMIAAYNNLYQPGLEQHIYSPLWYTMAARLNTTDTLYSVAPSGEAHEYPYRYNLQGSASYVTGSHNVKLGFLNTWGHFNEGNFHNADVVQDYQTQNGVPNTPYQVTIYPTDPRYNESARAVSNIYLQDSWTRKRLTLTGGLRWDYVQEYVGGQPIQQGTFETIPAFADIMLPSQKNWSPTISGVLDVFGDGKTALRGGFRHFVASATIGLATTQQVGSGNTMNLPWTDVNHDNIVEYPAVYNSRGQIVPCAYPQPGCEVNFATVPANFGFQNLSATLDPGLQRPTYNQYNVGISRELTSGISLSAEYFRTDAKNIQATQNQNLQTSGAATANPNFQAFTVFSPIDGHPVPEYDYSSLIAANKPVTNLTFTDSQQTSVYKGIDVALNARLPHGFRLIAGTTTERTLANSCDLGQYNPNLLLYCDQSNLGNGFSIPWKTQVKISGTYPLPWAGLIVNGTYQGLPGYTEAATTYSVNKNTVYTVCPAASVAAGCVVGGKIAGSLLASSVTVNLDPPNTSLTPRVNETDIGVQKRLKFGRVRFDPRFDVYNLFNSSAYYTVRSTSFSPILDTTAPNPTLSPALPSLAAGTNYTNFRAPARFLDGRMFRVGFTANW